MDLVDVRNVVSMDCGEDMECDPSKLIAGAIARDKKFGQIVLA